MKYHIFYFLIMCLFFDERSFGQAASTLNVGDKAPGLVLSSNNNSIQSFNFPYQNKMMLLFFWSSSVSKSKENIYKYKRLYSKYANLSYKSCDGFDLLSIAVQSDKMSWEQDLIKYDLLKMNNCIAQRGFSDLSIKSYKITKTPTVFLIDESGKIIFINPSVSALIEYLDQKMNSQSSSKVQTKLVGKIMYGNGQLMPLTDEKIYFLNDNRDTIQSVILDEKGAFILIDINIFEDLTIYVPRSIKINVEQTVFLTSKNGEIVSDFIKNEKGYNYTLLDAEMPYLKPLFVKEPSIKSDKGSLKELYFNERIFKGKTSVLSKEAIAKLNMITAKLKENPKTRIEIISCTDSNGDAKVNLNLTLKQSAVIAAHFVSKGITETRIKSLGKGETEILNKCKDGIVCSEEEHSMNRRTEFKFYHLQ